MNLSLEFKLKKLFEYYNIRLAYSSESLMKRINNLYFYKKILIFSFLNN